MIRALSGTNSVRARVLRSKVWIRMVTPVVREGRGASGCGEGRGASGRGASGRGASDPGASGWLKELHHVSAAVLDEDLLPAGPRDDLVSKRGARLLHRAHL